MDALLIILVAVLIDATVGDVPNAIHPLRWIGNILGWLDRHYSRKHPKLNKLEGFLSYLFILLLTLAVAFLILAAVHHYLGEIAWIIVTAIFFKVTFAVFCFRKVAKPIQKDLRDGKIEDAAAKVQMIVSRKTKGMDGPHVASSCVESIAENYGDSVVSPLTYFGLFGLFGGIMFRCSNLMDAMWGYLNDKYRNLGFFPAKLDDVLGFIPARITPLFLSLGALLLGMHWKDAVPAALAEHRKTPSPNSGWPMTAFAAAMGVRFEKAGVYVMGKGEMPTADDISRALHLVELSSLLYMFIVTLPLYAFLGIYLQVGLEGWLCGLLGWAL
jgi:adenosylcobinamide-phosphate synthase